MICKQTMSEAIYVAKGVGIILVVTGHFQVPSIEPSQWADIRKIIYSFHMPLFMALSGYLLGQSLPTINIRDYYGSILQKKIKRLLYPYITLSLLLLSVKIAAEFVTDLQHPVDAGLYKYILLNPIGGFSTLLWFLYVLFIIYLIFPLFRIIINNDILLLLTVLVLSYFQWPNEFCFNLVMHHLPYFIAGYLVANNNLIAIFPFRILLPIFFILFTIATTFRMMDTFQSSIMQKTLSLCAGYSGISIIFLLSLSITLYYSNKFKKIYSYIKIIGIYSSSIYLLHTLCMGPVRIFLTKLKFLNTDTFLMSAFIVCASGIIFPILIQKQIIDHIPLARKLILGAK